MSGWQELKAERNQRSLIRLTKALPRHFHELYYSVLLAAPSSHRRRGLPSSHTGVAIQFEPIA